MPWGQKNQQTEVFKYASLALEKNSSILRDGNQAKTFNKAK